MYFEHLNEYSCQNIYIYMYVCIISDGADSTMSPAEAPSTPVKPSKEEEDISMHPRKRKIKRAEQIQAPTQSEPETQEPEPDNNNTLKKEKVPNPYEIYLTLRKKVS